MKKTLLFLKKEILELLPPTIFFFLVFQVMSFARGLLVKEYDLTLSSTTSAFIGAIIVGKSILIVDALPMLKWFHQKRLIYTVLWRIFFYLLIVVIFQFLETLIPLISKYGSISSAIDHIFEEIRWDHFFAIHVILLLFIIIYALITAVVETIGRKEFIKIFFGKNDKVGSSTINKE
jgi:hypothetical protein